MTFALQSRLDAKDAKNNHSSHKEETIKEGDKFFLIVRSDIAVGRASAQLVHAAIEFCLQYPTELLSWYKNSNYVAVLAVPNEIELMRLIVAATDNHIKHCAFREPDLDNRYTAIAIEASQASRTLTKNLKSAFK